MATSCTPAWVRDLRQILAKIPRGSGHGKLGSFKKLSIRRKLDDTLPTLVKWAF